MTNEEKFKTPEERAEAYKEFCVSKKCDECECAKHGHKGISLCEFRWLTLEAEEEKPLPCPFCGGEAIAVCGPISMEEHHLRCMKCNATSRLCDTKAEAIAAWNRRVK